jgi:hypothetical protein
MFMRNQRIVLPLALVCLVVSIFIGRLFTEDFPRMHFFEGLFLGLSFSLGVFALILGARGNDST